MSKFTDLRDSAAQNVTLALTQMLFSYVKEKLIGRAGPSEAVPAPPELGDSDCPTGASSGATREADGRAGP